MQEDPFEFQLDSKNSNFKFKVISKQQLGKKLKTYLKVGWTF